MSHLLLTLGHNSSAILVDEGEIKIGYETERITGIKSDSAFPMPAIMEIAKWYPIEEITEIYISHWFLDPEKKLKDQGKWYDDEFMRIVFPEAKIFTLGRLFTHHDAHAYSVWCFNGASMPVDTHTLVIDGFGSYGETISIYSPDGNVIFRSFGFNRSLGLMYQYATSFLDMKENQDEYKLLGYESNIENLWSYLISPEDVLIRAHRDAMVMFNSLLMGGISTEYDPMISLDALVATKKYFRDMFTDMLTELHIENMDHDSDVVKTVVAFYVQSVVQEVVIKLLDYYDIENVSLVGGVFMNVKLNNEIAESISGKTSIMPLCGDQGAAIGLYAYHRNLTWPGHLFWGKRAFDNLPRLNRLVVNDDPGFVIDLLKRNIIVNLVRGDMEFGARALGHTSTLALPTKENVEYINHLNNRSTIMPMAPVIVEEYTSEFFMDENDISQSLEYMVCTRTCIPILPKDMYGVTHTVPTSDERTCRPQVINRKDDFYLHRIVKEFGVLINTSFNEHGQPIVFNEEDIKRCHLYQGERDHEHRVLTVVMGVIHDGFSE